MYRKSWQPKKGRAGGRVAALTGRSGRQRTRCVGGRQGNHEPPDSDGTAGASTAGAGQLAYQGEVPPSTLMAAPVIPAPAGDASNIATAAHSSTVLSLPVRVSFA